MKTLLFSLISFIAISQTLAQDYKGSLPKAENYLAEGKLAEAKKEVDAVEAAEIAKLKKKGKELVPKVNTLYVKGKVYQAIALSKEDKYKSLDETPIKTAMKAYDMVLKEYPKSSQATMIKEGGADPNNLAAGLLPPTKEQFYAGLINMSAEAYNNQNMEDAMAYAEKALMIMPKDTLAMSYAAQFAYDLEDKEKVIKYSNELLKEGFKKPYLYSWQLMYAMETAEEKYNSVQDKIEKVTEEYTKKISELNVEKNKAQVEKLSKELEEKRSVLEKNVSDFYTTALSIIEGFKKDFPNDEYMRNTEINIYLRTGKAEEAISSIENSLKEKPNDKQLLFALGVMYEQVSQNTKDKTPDSDLWKTQQSKAAEAYKKAIEQDDTFYNAYLNLGGIYYNSANDIIRKLNELEMDNMGRYKNKKEADKLVSEIKSLYSKAKPIFEKAQKHKPDTETQNLNAFIDRINYFNKQNP